MQKTVQCKVEGMTCGNCALSISNYLNKQGAADVVANASTGDLSFVIDENTDPDTLYQGIDRLGFTVKRETNVHNAAKGHTHSRIKPLLLISMIFWLPLMAHMFVHWPVLHEPLTQLILVLPIYILACFYFGKSALRSLRNGIPNMDVLVFIGATAAFVYSLVGWYLHPGSPQPYLFFETTASIITLVLAGNFLEEFSVRSTASSIQELIKYQRASALLVLTDSIGKESFAEISNEEIKVNDILQLKTGDKVPADGLVMAGEAAVDESMMSGESLPVIKSKGDLITGGTIISDGHFRMRATAVGSETALANMIDLVNRAQAAKPPMQKLADRISAIFVPVVLAIAVLTFLINYFGLHVNIEQSMMRSIAVLVIACPCAMGLATPAAVMVGLGRAARMGILIKGGDTLEKFRDIKQFVFDKTGTLTTGNLVIDCFETKIDEPLFQQVISSMEQYSSHPIAKSICKAWPQSSLIGFATLHEMKGQGISATDEQGHTWTLGSYRILPTNKPAVPHDLYLLKDGEQVGWVNLRDEIRPDAELMLRRLKSSGYTTVLLSGDRKEKCEQIASVLPIDKVFAEQLPEDKMSILDALNTAGKIAMVGDGINDAPALAKAHIGISLSDATQIAMQTAQVILLNNKLSLIPDAIALGKKTFLTIQQNLFWAFFYNVVAIPVAAAGFLTPTWGAGIMALSDVVLIINSIRLRYRQLS